MNTSRHRLNSIAVILILHLFLLPAFPVMASVAGSQQVLSAVLERSSQGIVFGVQKTIDAINSFKNPNFGLRLTEHRVADANHKLILTIDGHIALPGNFVNHGLKKWFPNETPLPQRPECRAFIKMKFPAEGAPELQGRNPVRVPFRIDAEVKVDQCLKILAMMGMGMAIEQVDLIPVAKVSQLLAQVPSEHVRTVLQKFFPSLDNFLLKKLSSNFFDQLLKQGHVSGQAMLTSIGVGDFLGFLLGFGVGIAESAALAGVTNAAQLGVGAAIITMPGVGNVAVGAMLVVVSARLTQAAFTLGKEVVEWGIWRDRFAKIEGYLQGSWSPGKAQADWLEKQVAYEAARDDFSAVHRLIMHLRAMPLLRRAWFKEYMQTLRVPIARQAEAKQSFVAQKYTAIIDVLFLK